MFVTDAILATLMCASRSAYSWDIVVDKIGGKVKDDIFIVHFLKILTVGLGHSTFEYSTVTCSVSVLDPDSIRSMDPEPGEQIRPTKYKNIEILCFDVLYVLF